MLRIGRNGAYEAVATGVIPSIRIGRKIRVPRKALAAWIDAADEDRPVETPIGDALPVGEDAPKPVDAPSMGRTHRLAE